MEIRNPKFKEGDKVLEIGNPKSGVWEVKRISKYDFFTDLYIYVLKSEEDGISLISNDDNLKPYIEKPKSVWNLEKGDKYYYLSSYCKISEFIFDDTPFEKNVLEEGNGFLTKEEAEFECERRKIEVKMIKLGGRRKFKKGEDNYYIYCDFSFNYEIHFYKDTDDSLGKGVIYFDSIKDGRNAIDSIGEDRIKKYYFGVEE